jgi:hypothetical protein
MTEALNPNEVLDQVEAQLRADGHRELAAKIALVCEYLGKLVVAQTEIMQTTDALVEDTEGLLGSADTGKQDAGSHPCRVR